MLLPWLHSLSNFWPSPLSQSYLALFSNFQKKKFNWGLTRGGFCLLFALVDLFFPCFTRLSASLSICSKCFCPCACHCLSLSVSLSATVRVHVQMFAFAYGAVSMTHLSHYFCQKSQKTQKCPNTRMMVLKLRTSKHTCDRNLCELWFLEWCCSISKVEIIRFAFKWLTVLRLTIETRAWSNAPSPRVCCPRLLLPKMHEQDERLREGPYGKNGNNKNIAYKLTKKVATPSWNRV